MTERFGTHVNFLPEHTAFGVACFAHEECPDSGGLYRVEGGTIYKIRYQSAKDKYFDCRNVESPEDSKKLLKHMLNNFKETAIFNSEPRYPQHLKFQSQKYKMRLLPIVDDVNGGGSSSSSKL